MQRRAAAIYAVFFIVLGAASYSVIATATAPTIEFPDADGQLLADPVGVERPFVDDRRVPGRRRHGHVDARLGQRRERFDALFAPVALFADDKQCG